RRGDDRLPVGPLHVAQHERGGLVPRHPPQRGEVGHHHEVAVPALPARHRVAVHGVHLDVDREQVVARLGGVRDDLVEEVRRGAPLALQAALHVGERDEDRVDRAVVDHRAQLLEGEHPGAGHGVSFRWSGSRRTAPPKGSSPRECRPPAGRAYFAGFAASVPAGEASVSPSSPVEAPLVVEAPSVVEAPPAEAPLVPDRSAALSAAPACSSSVASSFSAALSSAAVPCPWPRASASASSCASMLSSSATEPPSGTGPVNHLRAEIRYQPPNRIRAPPTVMGA